MNRSEFWQKEKENKRGEKSRRRRTKRSNGTGTIEYRADRKNKYRVKVLIKDDTADGKRRYKTLGSYATRDVAERVLADYNRSPYMVEGKMHTFSDLYAAWSEGYFQEYHSASNRRNIESIYAYCHDIYDLPIRIISEGTIRDLMMNAYVTLPSGEKKMASINVQKRIKSLCNLMFDYAHSHRLVIENPARAFRIKKILHEVEQNTKEKKPFCWQEITCLWNVLDRYLYADMVLIGIYTGFRPLELCKLKTDNVHLQEKYIVGGMKTEYGRDRIVPIHPDILDLVQNRYNKAVEECKTGFLFNLNTHDGWKELTYEQYRRRFQKIMEDLGMEGLTPHCTRHTFATAAELCGLRELAIKQILGHSYRSDVTDKHYKHMNLEYLKKEMEKLDFRGVDDICRSH